MFDCDCYLVGGATRDIIWDRKIKDLDIKLSMEFDEVIEKLKEIGFKKTSSIHLTEKEYYLNEKNKTVSIFSGGYDIDLGVLFKNSIAEAIKLSDLNFNCCIYNIGEQKIINPQIIKEINSKELKFTDIDRIKEDPLLILNALKQISRVPEIIISPEIQDKIKSNSQRLFSFLKENKGHVHKLESITNNINSKFAISLLDNQEQIVDLLEPKSKDIFIDDKNYEVCRINEMSIEDKNLVSAFFKKMYGKNFDEEKMFADKNTHLVIERYRGNTSKEVQSCLVMQNSRLYSVAAISWYKLFNLVKDLVESNNDI
jgi:hypothetical protein